MSFTPATTYLTDVEAAMAYMAQKEDEIHGMWLAVKANGIRRCAIEGAFSFSLYGKEVIRLSENSYVFREDGLTYEFKYIWQWLCYMVAVHG